MPSDTDTCTMCWGGEANLVHVPPAALTAACHALPQLPCCLGTCSLWHCLSAAAKDVKNGEEQSSLSLLEAFWGTRDTGGLPLWEQPSVGRVGWNPSPAPAFCPEQVSMTNGINLTLWASRYLITEQPQRGTEAPLHQSGRLDSHM